MPQPKKSSQTNFPEINETRQVRLAVVIYGGVSLAIYINGITQELFKLVRATAPLARDAAGQPAPLSGRPNGETSNASGYLRSTERVYRKLSYLLTDPDLLRRYDEYLAHTNGHAPDPLEAAVSGNQPIQLRFIIDILSGTSAGGLNAIVLAKALANDLPIDQLQQLWLEQGDLALLINDGVSVEDIPLAAQSPPQSLLNSRRMYLQLLRAFDRMGRAAGAESEFDSPYVGELDLYVTATDLAGLKLPLRLFDQVIEEKRHRHVFHFRYATGATTGQRLNDFIFENNPFLAFAARCTSSFPFAFEPMRLADIDEVLALPEFKDKHQPPVDTSKWARFFEEDVTGQTGAHLNYAERAFGDGGYLDNKPFSFATETLTSRQAAVPVDRKLIYIEPSPEEFANQAAEQPDALSNAKLALIDLPGYETIREDLQRVLRRNRLINRVNRITSGIENDINLHRARTKQTNWREKREKRWRELDLPDMVAHYGPYYLPYRRLRISGLTDDIALIVARNLEIDPESDYFLAIRALMQAWREKRYFDIQPEAAGTDQAADPDSPETGPAAVPRLSINSFLDDYDLNYRLRRLVFLTRRIDQLYQLTELVASAPEGAAVYDRLTKEQRRLVHLLKNHADPKIKLDLLEAAADKHQTEALRANLSRLKRELLDNFYNPLLSGRARLMTAKGQPNLALPADQEIHAFKEELKHLSVKGPELKLILGNEGYGTTLSANLAEGSAEDECVFRAKQLVEGRPELAAQFDAVADKLEKAITAILLNGGPRIRTLLRTHKPDTPGVRAINAYLFDCFDSFDDYDQIRFPIFFDTEVGESDVVEIVRISPEDATSLINEHNEKQKPRREARLKLAGNALHHFGAFLDRTWRKNDLLWGRLDGAERLITALLPEEQHRRVREALIEEANLTILEEEISLTSRQQLGKMMSETLIKASTDLELLQHVDEVVKQARDETPQKRLEEAILGTLQGRELLDFARSYYRVNRQLNPQAMLKLTARSLKVTGEIMDQVAKKRSLENRITPWVARLGTIFIGMIEVAVPNSLWNLLFRHALQLLYLFWAVLIIGSTVLGSDNAQKFGLTAFGLTAVAHLAMLLLYDRMRDRSQWKRIVLWGTAALILLLAAAGTYQVYQWLVALNHWVGQLWAGGK